MAWVRKGKFSVTAVICQILFIVLFAIFVDYDDGADARHDLDLEPPPSPEPMGIQLDQNRMAMFQDVNVMIFLGIGFLLTYMKRYSLSSVGFVLFIGAFCVQWAIVVGGLLHLDQHHGRIVININTLFSAEFAAATVLISFSAVLGRLSPLQGIVMAICEIIFFQVNEWLGLQHFRATDVGGSMFVHVFAAYFGMAVGAMLAKNKDLQGQEYKAASCYNSDIIAMIGTVFLWVYWPSFNAALAEGNAQHRAVINTYLSLAGCAIVVFATSALLDPEDKFDMEHVQNATLAGGVAMGAAADMMLRPWAALTVGAAAGLISTLGYKYLTPFLAHKLKLPDICGAHNLHGLPGIQAAIVSIIATLQASHEDYGTSLYKIFPAMAPAAGTAEYEALRANSTAPPGLGRTPSSQALWQLATLGATIAIAIVGGIVTGLLMKIPVWNRPEGEDIFEDDPWWHVQYGQPDATLIESNGKRDEIYDEQFTIANKNTSVL